MTRFRWGFLLMGLAVLLVALAVTTAWKQPEKPFSYDSRNIPSAAAAPDFQGDSRHSSAVNVNSASPESLTLLQGIGPVLAERVVLEREENGPFYFPEDLLSVSGIGMQKLSGFLDQIVTD
ncbi:MAG: helix-hairpin-helix domain-containing protein [Clostridia bacterium]|nr:helix-hairpin-helix domain-containing protein [Clostridia bacterium]